MQLTYATTELRRMAAQILAQAAHQAALSEGIAVAVVVVDTGGHPILVDRMDGAATCAVPLAQSKAETAAATQSATDMWFQSTQPGAADWGMNTALGGKYNAMPGGLPVEISGVVVGAIGVSGGSAVQDVLCARAALDALAKAD